MSTKLRKLLYPLSLLYEGVTQVRNTLYDKRILKSNEFEIPTIQVGNLRIGGTGKTPQVAYIIKLLIENYRVAVLSRGYKRKTSGFILANSQSTHKDIGDEPYQLLKQYTFHFHLDLYLYWLLNKIGLIYLIYYRGLRQINQLYLSSFDALILENYKTPKNLIDEKQVKIYY